MPAIIKPSRVSVAHQTEPSKDGALTTVSAYVLFDFAEPGRLLTEQALWPMVTDQIPNGAVFDKGQLKPKGEVIIAGCALSPADEPIEGIRVSARFGQVQKQLAVFGDRSWQLTDQGIQMTRPVPFLKMPIGDAQAFGGPSYAPNQRGKGHGARSLLEAGYDAPLPNVEDPGHLIKSVEDLPVPAHFGPIAADDAARLKYLGTYDQHWIDHVSPLKPDDFNPLYHCEAPPEQRLDGFIEGGEIFTISGMSRGEASVGGQLPRLTARCFYKPLQSDDLIETTMRCDTVTLFPNVQKATLTFRGLVRGTDRFAEDIAAIMVAVEHTDAVRREGSYYADVYAKRTSKDEAHKYALADYQLMPEVDPSIVSARRQARLDKAAADRQKFLDNQNWAARKMLEDEGLPGDLVPPPNSDILDDIPLVAQPTAEEIENGDLDLAAVLDDVKAVEDALLEKRDREMARAELQRRAVLAVTPPKLISKAMRKPIVDDDFLAEFPDVELDPEFAKSLDQVGGQLGSLRDGTGFELPAELEGAGDLAGDMLGSLSDLFDEDPAPSAEEIETAYQKAVARALNLPEGSILADARKAIDDMDLSGLDDLDAQLAGSADAADDPFNAMIGDLAAPANDTSPPAMRFSDLLADDTVEFPTDELNNQLEEALSSLNSPILPKDKPGEMLDTLMDRLQNIKPEGMDQPEGQTPGETARNSISTAKDRIDDAEETVAETMATGRQQSPAPLFPLEALPEGVAVRLGAFVTGKLRDGHDFKGADLAGADLRGVDFSGMDLSGTFFEQADLTDARFNGSNLSGAVFSGATLDNADFSDTDLTKANLNKASLKNIRLDRARMHDLLIIHSDLSGAAGTGADLEKLRVIESTLDGCRLENSQIVDSQILAGSADGFAASGSRVIRTMFVTVSMKAMDFSDSDLERVGFMEVNAPESRFVNSKWLSVGFMGACDLTQSRFDNLNATESSFNTAQLTESCFLRAKGNACFFNACNMEANDMRLISFRNSLFGRSNFAGSDFFGANLFGAALTGVDLRRCSMRAANLYAADLLEAKLASCDFTGANLGMTLMEQPTHA